MSQLRYWNIQKGKDLTKKIQQTLAKLAAGKSYAVLITNVAYKKTSEHTCKDDKILIFVRWDNR